MVIDVTQDTFQSEVVARSSTMPVIVDFWAEWCGPCRQLGPALEAAVNKREGEIVLAKVDADTHDELTQKYHVTSIPAVKAFVDGKVVAQFTGLRPPKELDEFISTLLPSEADTLVAKGDEPSLRRALELEPGRADASFLLAHHCYDKGEIDAALVLLDDVPGSFIADGLRARIELERAGQPDLSGAFWALDNGDLDKGLDRLLKAYPEADGRQDAVRRLVVGVLAEIDPKDPLAREYRRRLAELLP